MSAKKNNAKGAAATGLFAALAASSCCIPPVIAAIAGLGGISSGLSWMEPLRPYMIAIAVLAIAYAWYIHLKPKKADDCGCAADEKPRWYQARGFLVAITLFAALSVAFPYYSSIFFADNRGAKAITVNESDITEASLTIRGMSCTGCEQHVEQTLQKSEGVIAASSSYETGIAKVKFDKTKVTIDALATAVEKATGYEVTDIKAE